MPNLFNVHLYPISSEQNSVGTAKRIIVRRYKKYYYKRTNAPLVIMVPTSRFYSAYANRWIILPVTSSTLHEHLTHASYSNEEVILRSTRWHQIKISMKYIGDLELNISGDVHKSCVLIDPGAFHPSFNLSKLNSNYILTSVI